MYGQTWTRERIAMKIFVGVKESRHVTSATRRQFVNPRTYRELSTNQIVYNTLVKPIVLYSIGEGNMGFRQM